MTVSLTVVSQEVLRPVGGYHNRCIAVKNTLN